MIRGMDGAVGVYSIYGNGARGDYGTFKSPPLFTDHIWKLTGTTKDSTGVALGNCVVKLFYSLTNTIAGITESDASGIFTFLVGPSLNCYIVAYKPGSPDVAGTTVNTLVAT